MPHSSAAGPSSRASAGTKRPPEADDKEETDKKKRSPGDFLAPPSLLPHSEGSSQHSLATTITDTGLLERRGNWKKLTEGDAHTLYEAWWGKKITERVISGDFDNNVSSSSSAGMSPQPTIVHIDQSIGPLPIGEILLRREFVAARQFIESIALNYPASGVVISGQPGIGKTFFLWWLLRCRLSDKLPTVFAMGSDHYFFHETGAYGSSSPPIPGQLSADAATASGSHLVWALIDKMNEKAEPPAWLVTSRLFPVQTTYPNVLWYKNWMKQKSAQLYIMDPWDWDELVAGLPLQERLDPANINHSLLEKAYYKYGPVPRNVYAAHFDEEMMKTYDERTLAAIKKVSFAQLEQIVTEREKYDEISNKLICLRRVEPGVSYSAVLSTYVAEQLLKAEGFAELDEKRRFLNLFTSVPQMGSARGAVFEAYAHNRFACAGSPEGITFYTLTPTPAPTPRAKSKKSKSDEAQTNLDSETNPPQTYQPDLNSKTQGPIFPLMKDAYVYRSLDDFRAAPAAGYHKPSSKTNPGFDSFLITNTAVYIFQMTVSKAHAVDSPKAAGLGLLNKVLPRGLPWHYVLVVPHHLDVRAVKLTLVNDDWVHAAESFRLLMLN